MKDQRIAPNVSSYLGHNIRKLRTRSKISQAKLAGLLGISPQAVSKWERGTALPDIDLLIPLTSIFSITLDRLLTEDPEE